MKTPSLNIAGIESCSSLGNVMWSEKIHSLWKAINCTCKKLFLCASSRSEIMVKPIMCHIFSGCSQIRWVSRWYGLNYEKLKYIYQGDQWMKITVIIKSKLKSPHKIHCYIVFMLTSLNKQLNKKSRGEKLNRMSSFGVFCFLFYSGLL
jgi:hypothetical protein